MVSILEKIYVGILIFLFWFTLFAYLIRLYFDCIELRKLKRNTYNAYMNMVQGMEERGDIEKLDL